MTALGFRGFAIARREKEIPSTRARSTGVRDAEPGAPPGPGDRNPGLDGVRGLAILLVLLRHTVDFVGVAPVSTMDALFNTASMASWVGVDLFFVLSGFLITGILFDTRTNQHYFRMFYMRRVLRIVPVYFLFLALYFTIGTIVEPASQDPNLSWHGLAWAASYLSNIATAVHGWGVLPHPVRHVWSLAVEEQFYLVWPLLIWKPSRRSLLALSLIMIVASWGVRAAFLAAGNPVAGYVLTPARLGPLALGGFVAIAMREVSARRALARLAPLVIAGTSTVVVGILYVRHRFFYLDPITQLLGFDALALLFAGLIVMVLTARPSSVLARVFGSRILRSFGRYSYAMYLVHQPLILALAGIGLTAAIFPPILGSMWPSEVLVFLIETLATTALAFVSWHLWEQPFLRLKERFAYR